MKHDLQSLDGVLLGGAGGRLFRVHDPKRWQLHRRLWLFCAQRFPWLWTKRGKPAPATGVVEIHGRELTVVRDEKLRLPCTPHDR